MNSPANVIRETTKQVFLCVLQIQLFQNGNIQHNSKGVLLLGGEKSDR